MIFHAVIKNTVKWFILIFGISKRPEGMENLPKSGGFIVSANHSSNWDGLKLGTLLPGYIRVLSKKELFNNKILGWMLPRVGAIPVERGKGDVGAMRAAEEALMGGACLMIFPQGTRKKVFRVEDGKKGAERLAEKCAVPVVPCAIKGRRIIIGKPIEAPKTIEIMEKIEELLKERG